MNCCCPAELKETQLLKSDPLMDMMWGLEKESLRVNRLGELSEAPHPAALAEPVFTKDFAESQLEMVTPPMELEECALGAMASLENTAAANLAGDESLWPFSMPPYVSNEEKIRLADFGDSPEGLGKQRYREGLVARYGKTCQIISGLHVNVSLGDHLLEELSVDTKSRAERDSLYMKLVRNLYRHLPLLYLLFSQSPVAAGKSAPRLSYRKSNDGYPQMEGYLNLNSLKEYVAGIRRAMREPHEGIRNKTNLGLNDRRIQSDKEFYAPIRLKAHIPEGETNTQSTVQRLEQNGIYYLELRFCDLDPWQPAGISPNRLRLLRLIILEAVLGKDTQFRDNELKHILHEAEQLASSVLDRDLLINPKKQALHRKTLERMRGLAAQLDESREDQAFQTALEEAISEIKSPETLPSFRLWNEYKMSEAASWTEFGTRFINQTNRISWK